MLRTKLGRDCAAHSTTPHVCVLGRFIREKKTRTLRQEPFLWWVLCSGVSYSPRCRRSFGVGRLVRQYASWRTLLYSRHCIVWVREYGSLSSTRRTSTVQYVVQSRSLEPTQEASRVRRHVRRTSGRRTGSEGPTATVPRVVCLCACDRDKWPACLGHSSCQWIGGSRWIPWAMRWDPISMHSAQLHSAFRFKENKRTLRTVQGFRSPW